MCVWEGGGDEDECVCGRREGMRMCVCVCERGEGRVEDEWDWREGSRSRNGYMNSEYVLSKRWGVVQNDCLGICSSPRPPTPPIPASPPHPTHPHFSPPPPTHPCFSPLNASGHVETFFFFFLVFRQFIITN